MRFLGRIGGAFDGYRSALAQQDLRLLLSGLTISTSGSWAYNVGLLAFVYDRTHSLGWVGATGIVRYLTGLLVTPYAGVIAERTERIRLMVSSDVASCLSQVALCLVAVLGGPVVLALIFSCVTAATTSVYSPAVAATIPAVVSERDLVAANALNSTIDNLVVIVGPAIGAAILLIGSPTAVFAVNAASFAISALLVLRIRTRTTTVDVTEAGEAGFLQQMSVGLKTIYRLSAARTLVAFSVLVTFVWGTDTVLFIAVSAHRLGTGAKGWGYLLAGLGVGGILMAALVDKLAASRRLAPIILIGALGYCLPTALLAIVHSPGVAFAIEVFRGGATLVVDVLAVTAMQRAVPADQLARVFGIFFTFVCGACALGALAAPPIVSAAGLNGGLLALAFGPAALAMLGLPALLAIDRATAAHTAELEPRVTLLEGLGIFATANRALLERLASMAQPATYAAGTEILTEGQPADSLYVLAAGEVQVSAHGERGGPASILRTMHAPTYFGEIGVLERIPRTATVTATSECRCELIDGAELLDALAATPASSSLVENTRRRLALTHPSRPPAYTVIQSSPA